MFLKKQFLWNCKDCNKLFQLSWAFIKLDFTNEPSGKCPTCESNKKILKMKHFLKGHIPLVNFDVMLNLVKEVMFCFLSFFFSFLCVQDYSKCYGWIFMKMSGHKEQLVKCWWLPGNIYQSIRSLYSGTNTKWNLKQRTELYQKEAYLNTCYYVYQSI